MIRILFFVVLVLALAFGFAWLADRPGDLSINWQGREIEMSLMAAVTMIVSLIAAIMITWWLIRTILYSPRTLARYFRANKRDRGYQALSTGLLAAGSGDAATARKMNKRTKGLLNADQEPLIHLLDVQAALIEGRHEEARKLFEAMSEDPETKLLGLRGLYLEAQRQGAGEAAQHYAEKAADEAPHLPWAGAAALSYRTREGKWDEALKLLDRQRQAGTVQVAEVARTKAVLLTARARDHVDSDPSSARDDALAALKLAPGFPPAAVVAAKALLRQDNLRKAARTLEAAWKHNPHPEIAETYVRARVGDTAADRLKRAERLEKHKPLHPLSLEVVARAALEAHRFDLAREKAEASARLQPCEGIFLLLADIEEAETDDQGRVRHWLSQAVRAPRDPAWTADGYVSESWEPVSPVSGKLDAFEWKVPVEQLAGPSIDNEPPAQVFDRAMASLPPITRAPKPRPAPVSNGATASVAPVADKQAGASPSADKPAEAGGKLRTANTNSGPVIESDTVADSKQQAAPVSGSAGKPADNARTKPKQDSAVAAVSPAKDTPDDTAAAEAKVKVADPDPADNSGKAGAAGLKPAEPGTSKKPVQVAAKADEDPEADAKAKEAAFLTHRPDDPGIDGNDEPEKPGRFRLF
ncbi:HemY protein [Hoeflea halophila]|uniref:HemY protein n=1 Tax=Hoeflea halophila TaxID=714899 RepID=A0A286I9U5_9HYPH|nr:heme biosynthesis HemY N-terminal domain-containing protein [Hoeflea halophila]SOE16888.1 HemY protein [Hoeflea halophila]